MTEIVEGNYTVVLNRRHVDDSLPPDVLTCGHLREAGVETECCEFCHLKADVGWIEGEIDEEMGYEWVEANYNGIHTTDDVAHLFYAESRVYLCCECEQAWLGLPYEDRMRIARAQ